MFEHWDDCIRNRDGEIGSYFVHSVSPSKEDKWSWAMVVIADDRDGSWFLPILSDSCDGKFCLVCGERLEMPEGD